VTEAAEATIAAIAATRSARMDEACASVLRVGWSPLDCRVVHDTVTKRDVLVVRGVQVFEITERWTDTTCHLAWRWLAEIPVREGFTPASA
jgi:hypothetical protein